MRLRLVMLLATQVALAVACSNSPVRGYTGDAGCSDTDHSMCPCNAEAGVSNGCYAYQRCEYGPITCECRPIPQQTGLAEWLCGPADGGASATR